MLCASPSATGLRWARDRDPVECTLYFYFGRTSATPQHTQGTQAIAMRAVAISQYCLTHRNVYADSYSCTLWGRDQVRRVCVGRAIVTQSNALCVQVRVLYPWLLHCANRRADSNPNFSSTLVSTMRSSINIVRLCRRVAALELQRQCNRAFSRKPPERAHGSVTHRWLDAYSDYVNLQLRLADIENVCDTFAVAARA